MIDSQRDAWLRVVLSLVSRTDAIISEVCSSIKNLKKTITYSKAVVVLLTFLIFVDFW